jgi:hypothetical protein
VAQITGPSRHHPEVEMTYEDRDNPGQKIFVVASAMEQSRLNKVAALWTALAVLLQALASMCGAWAGS